MIGMKKILPCLLLACTLASCGEDSDEKVAQTAADWGDAYFNCDFRRALSLSTGESERWLRFAASNTTQAELDLLNDRPAEVVADHVSDGDTLRIVTLQVTNYVKPVPLGAQPVRCDEGRFTLTVVKRDGEWKVRMADLPRNERQSRD